MGGYDCDGCRAPFTLQVIQSGEVGDLYGELLSGPLYFCADTSLVYRLYDPVLNISYDSAIVQAQQGTSTPDNTSFGFSDLMGCTEICSNGIDDDGDGFTDCSRPTWPAIVAAPQCFRSTWGPIFRSARKRSGESRRGPGVRYLPLAGPVLRANLYGLRARDLLGRGDRQLWHPIFRFRGDHRRPRVYAGPGAGQGHLRKSARRDLYPFGVCFLALVSLDVPRLRRLPGGHLTAECLGYLHGGGLCGQRLCFGRHGVRNGRRHRTGGHPCRGVYRRKLFIQRATPASGHCYSLRISGLQRLRFDGGGGGG